MTARSRTETASTKKRVGQEPGQHVAVENAPGNAGGRRTTGTGSRGGEGALRFPRRAGERPAPARPLPSRAGDRDGPAGEQNERSGVHIAIPGGQPALLGPGLAGREQNVVQDEDREREGEALPFPPRREVSASGIPTTAKARQAKGIENFLWISTQASRRFSGRLPADRAGGCERARGSDCARSDFS